MKKCPNCGAKDRVEREEWRVELSARYAEIRPN